MINIYLNLCTVFIPHIWRIKRTRVTQFSLVKPSAPVKWQIKAVEVLGATLLQRWAVGLPVGSYPAPVSCLDRVRPCASSRTNVMSWKRCEVALWRAVNVVNDWLMSEGAATCRASPGRPRRGGFNVLQGGHGESTLPKNQWNFEGRKAKKSRVTQQTELEVGVGGRDSAESFYVCPVNSPKQIHNQWGIVFVKLP